MKSIYILMIIFGGTSLIWCQIDVPSRLTEVSSVVSHVLGKYSNGDHYAIASSVKEDTNGSLIVSESDEISSITSSVMGHVRVKPNLLHFSKKQNRFHFKSSKGLMPVQIVIIRFIRREEQGSVFEWVLWRTQDKQASGQVWVIFSGVNKLFVKDIPNSISF
jgi:hypothetical protein